MTHIDFFVLFSVCLYIVSRICPLVQLKGLVEGIRNASIFKLSCFAEEETENHAVFKLLQLAFM